MFTPLILFLGLTVATAVIAHWSDNLGKKLGKKRVSLFGLRPRTTATILTVASSWGIMLFTLVALLVAVAPLRNMLFSYDRERAQAQRDRQQAGAQIQQARARLTATQNQYDTASGQLDLANGELNQAQANLKAAKLAVKSSQAAAKNAEKQGKKRADAAKKQADVAVARAETAQKRVITAQASLALAQKSLSLAQAREAIARSGEVTAKNETITAKRASRLARLDLKQTQINLKQTRNQLKITEKKLKTADTSVANAKAQLYRTGRELLNAENQLQPAQQLAAFSSPFIGSETPVKVDQTFAAQTIRTNQSPQIIAVQLRALLRQAQQSFDAIEDISPRFPANTKLQLAPLPDLVNGKIVYLTAYQSVLRLARSIAVGREDNSIRVVALRNFLASEDQIDVRFVAVPVAPAFASGEILAAATIDGAQEDWRIFRSLQDLLNLGQQRAETVGVMPPFLPEEPYFYASGTNVRIFAALRAIEASKRRLQVNLVAYKALSTVEPLQVRFEIEGLGAPDASATSDVSPTPSPTSPVTPAVPVS